MITTRIKILEDFLTFLGHEGKGVTYLHAIGDRKKGEYAVSQRIDNTDDMINFVEKYDTKRQIYTSLNPVRSGLDTGHSPIEDDVVFVINVLLDCDSKRIGVKEDHMATIEEYEAVWPVIDKINGWLKDQGFKCGYCDKTGNGIRFILPIPPYDVSDPTIREVWKEKVKTLFKVIENDLKIKLDKVVFDTRRITGLITTLNKKKEAQGREHRIREPGEILERVEDPKLLEYILSLKPDSVVTKTTDKAKQPTGETPTIENTTKVHYSDVLNDLIKNDQEFVRLYSGDLTKVEADDRSKVEMIVVNKLIKKGYNHNKNSLNFDELNVIMNKCKIGKWADDTDNYRTKTFNSALDFCEPQETHTTEAQTAIKAEIEPGVFLVSDVHNHYWKSSITKDGRVVGQKVTSKFPLWEADEKRDRVLKQALGLLEIGDKTTRSNILLSVIGGISETTREHLLNTCETPKPQTKALEDKYTPDILKMANDMLNTGNAFDYIQATWHNRHVGDDTIGECCAAAAAATLIKNTAGLHMKPSGESGKGKSAGLKAFTHLLPEGMVIEASMSSKAAFYDDELTEGTIIFSDDINLTDGNVDSIKRSITNYQQDTWHYTVNKDLTLSKMQIPKRVSWWFTSVDSLDDDQMGNRFLAVNVDDSTTQDKAVFERQKKLEREGVLSTTIDDDVLICRAIFDILKQDEYKIVVAFNDCIVWGNTENRRNFPMFLDIIKSVVLFSIRNREKFNGEYLPTIDDFNKANKIYAGMAETNKTNLSEIELKTMRFIADKQEKKTKNVKNIAKAIGKGEGSTRNYLKGRKESINSKGLLDKIPGLHVEEYRESEYNKDTGEGSNKPIEVYSYTGKDFNGVFDYASVAQLDESRVKEEIEKYKKQTQDKQTHKCTTKLHQFYMKCENTKQPQEDNNINNNKQTHNKCEKKREEKNISSPDVNKEDNVFLHTTPVTCENVNLSATVSDSDFTSGVNLCKLVKKQLDEKYTGDNLERLYGIILEDIRKRKGNNGKLQPIGDLDIYCDALLSRVEELRHYRGQTTDILKIMVEYDNNGGVPA